MHLGTQLILLSVRVFHYFSVYARVACKKNVNKCQICQSALGLHRNCRIIISGNSNITSRRQTEKWKALKPRVEANVPRWAQRSQESIWEFGGKVGDRAGKRVMECEI
jgi:hypothetical protein